MKRQIGIIGTSARAIIGVLLVGSLVYGHMVRGPFRPLPWIIGLVVLPGIFFTWQWARARRNPSRFEATGPIASAINVIVFFYFLLFAPRPLAWLSDGVLLFYSVSMCLAAIRGYAGCESLAIPNWLLKRDDQLGCLFFSPIDSVERRAFHHA
ncbi:MAG TPA: hypothetical protein VGA61_06955 [Anaerolineae bacterium]